MSRLRRGYEFVGEKRERERERERGAAGTIGMGERSGGVGACSSPGRSGFLRVCFGNLVVLNDDS